MTNTERNTALAEIFGPEGYEAATECPQGHEDWVAIEHYDYDDHDFYTEDIGYGTGALCLRCLTLDPELMQGVGTDRAYYAYDTARIIRGRHNTDPTWHPEWRIQAMAKDFTVPWVLEPLVARLGYSWIHTAIPKSKDTRVKHLVELYLGVSFSAPFFALRFGKLVPDGDGIGESYEIALGEALLSAQASLGR